MSGHPIDHAERKKRTWTVVGTICGILAAVFFLTGDEPLPEGTDLEVASLPPIGIRDLGAGLDYPLNQVADSKLAPPVFIKSLKFDLTRIPEVAEKKAVFFRIMLPYIARENDRIRAERKTVEDAPDAVPAHLYEKYDVAPGDQRELLRRIDVVPASLVLAQAALESGWGSSRFAVKGNNFFGMRTYDPNVAGMKPKGAEGFKVTIFRDIGHSVRSYMKNLNTHGAYKQLRAARASMRAKGSTPSGTGLTNYLSAYSEIPEEYGKRLRGMISANKLARFDGVKLAGD